MSIIDPQTTQQIVQLLSTYGNDAGIAAAGALGTGAVQALGIGAKNAIKSLWVKIRKKSEEEGGITKEAITAFEAASNEKVHQQILSVVLMQLCDKDAAFAHEITQLLNDVKRDPVAGQFIQHISDNATVGVVGVIYGPVSIQQIIQQSGSSWRESIKTSLKEFVMLWTETYGKENEKLIDPFLAELQIKFILISHKLSTLLSKNSSDISNEVLSNISGIAKQLETLGRLHFPIDGGLSVKKFDELGESIKKDAVKLVEQINKTK